MDGSLQLIIGIAVLVASLWFRPKVDILRFERGLVRPWVICC